MTAVNIRYLNFADIDRMARSARAADQAYALNQLRIGDYMRKRDQEQTQDTLYRAAGGDAGLAAEMAAQEPGASMTTIKTFQDQAQQAEDRRTKKRTDALSARKSEIELAVKLDELLGKVGDQSSWDTYRGAATQVGQMLGHPVNLPEGYDENYVRARRARTRKQLELLSPEEAAAAGFRKGSVVTTEGKVLQSPEKPAKSGMREIFDENSPTGSRWVSDADALGRPGRPAKGRSGAGGITAAQAASNAEIDEARRVLKGLTRNEIVRRTQSTTQTGRDNLDYDPTLSATVTKALRRKVGVDDTEFETISGRLRGTGLDAGAAGIGSRAPADLSDDELLQALGVRR